MRNFLKSFALIVMLAIFGAALCSCAPKTQNDDDDPVIGKDQFYCLPLKSLDDLKIMFGKEHIYSQTEDMNAIEIEFMPPINSKEIVYRESAKGYTYRENFLGSSISVAAIKVDHEEKGSVQIGKFDCNINVKENLVEICFYYGKVYYSVTGILDNSSDDTEIETMTSVLKNYVAQML